MSAIRANRIDKRLHGTSSGIPLSVTWFPRSDRSQQACLTVTRTDRRSCLVFTGAALRFNFLLLQEAMSTRPALVLIGGHGSRPDYVSPGMQAACMLFARLDCAEVLELHPGGGSQLAAGGSGVGLRIGMACLNLRLEDTRTPQLTIESSRAFIS